MQDTIYVMTNKVSGETKDVVLHTAGNEFITFAEKAEGPAWENATQYRFENPDKSEDTLSSEEYTIARK